MRRSATDRERGVSVLELILAITIVGIAILVLMQQLHLGNRANDWSRDRVFAHQKAIAMMTEVQVALERGDIPDGDELDALADHGPPNPVLTTLKLDGAPVAPDQEMSGNSLRDGKWQWGRCLTVERFGDQEENRYLRIRVQRRTSSGAFTELAAVAGVVSLPVRASASVKVYDVYALAIDNVPSSNGSISALRSILTTAADEVSRPGLRFRLHWIRCSGYGRDPVYTPYVNAETATGAVVPPLFWYPGRGAGGREGELFNADGFSGVIRTESGLRNAYDPAHDSAPHAVADQFNHCLREPAARALFEARVAAGLEDRDAPPLQLLLEDMTAHPERFRNAIFVNLHGSALPFPPLRNYADAAKAPARLPGVRVVAHPARLWTPWDHDGNKATQPLELRVYAYRTSPGGDVLTEPVTVQIMGVDLSRNVNRRDVGMPETLEIRRLPGGIDTTTGNRAAAPYFGFDHLRGMPPLHAERSGTFEMAYEVGFTDVPPAHTWIRLYNTPLCAPRVGSQGLASPDRLYGLDYVPSPVGDDRQFVLDLATPTPAAGPCNTARWRIRIPKAVFEPGFPGGHGLRGATRIDVITRIGTDLQTGRQWPAQHEPHNFSLTYAWWTATADAVPFTERYQLLGDPRHCPYADLAAKGDGFASGYNCYFDDLRDGGIDATERWKCLDAKRLRDGYAATVRFDVPRMAQIWRDALRAGHAVFVNAGGALADSLLLGGDIALPAPDKDSGFDAVRLPGALYGEDLPVDVNTVLAGNQRSGIGPPGQTKRDPYGQPVLVASSGFWAKEWLGELVPDDAYATYLATGNLPAGRVPGCMHRRVRETTALADLPAGTSLASAGGSCPGGLGGVALVPVGNEKGTLGFVSNSTSVTLTAGGRDLLLAAGTSAPSPLTVPRPFSLQQSALDWKPHIPHLAFADAYPPQQATLLERLYEDRSSRCGAAVLDLTGPNAAAATLVLLAHVPADAAEQRDLMRAAVLFGLRGLHVAGEPAHGHAVEQQPLVEVVQPRPGSLFKDPVYVLVRWRARYLRFDNKPFTPGYPDGFVGTESDLEYVVKYSTDEGETWHHAGDGTAAEAGGRPDDPLLRLPDSGPGEEAYVMRTPAAGFPPGAYLVRVECFGRRRASHWSYHQQRLKVVRSP